MEPWPEANPRMDIIDIVMENDGCFVQIWSHLFRCHWFCGIFQGEVSTLVTLQFRLDPSLV